MERRDERAVRAEVSVMKSENERLRAEIEQQGLRVATLETCREHSAAREDGLRAELEAAIAALEPLKAIADTYDANELDDEARKRWGQNYEHWSTRPPEEIELYSGRGGKQLLTLQHCLDARSVMVGSVAAPAVRLTREGFDKGGIGSPPTTPRPSGPIGATKPKGTGQPKG